MTNRTRSSLDKSSQWVLIESTSLDGFVSSFVADTKEQADIMLNQWVLETKLNANAVRESVSNVTINMYADCSMASMNVNSLLGKEYTYYWTVQQPYKE